MGDVGVIRLQIYDWLHIALRARYEFRIWPQVTLPYRYELRIWLRDPFDLEIKGTICEKPIL